MLKFTAICLGLALSAATAAAEHAEGVGPGRKHAVVRHSADRYAVVGEGFVRTRGCTFTAPMVEARVEAGRRPWIWFYGRDGELEGGCELDPRPAAPRAARAAARIPRPIATTTGADR